MSLHRVSSMTSYEHVRGSSPARSEHQKISFDPVHSWDPPEAKEQPVGAYEVSKTKRILQVIFAVIYCLLSAGVVFGYAALKPVLIHEGVYQEFCSHEEVQSSKGKPCYEQEIRLNFMFTTAAVATNVCALPVGTLLDRYGPRVSGLVGAVLLAIGTLLLAFASQLPFDAYIPGYLFLALGGPFVFISSFQLSNTFPRHSGLILALLTGAFDSSSAIFLFYRLIYTASHGTFTLQKFFLVYLIVPVYILLVQLLIMPANSYKTVGELLNTLEAHSTPPNSNTAPHPTSHSSASDDDDDEAHPPTIDEMTSLLGHTPSKQHHASEIAAHEPTTSPGIHGALHGHSALTQIRSPWFILITLFTVIQMTRINYFVATIYTQYAYLLNPPTATSLNQIFDIALPLGGIIAIPFIGTILDHTSTPTVLALLALLAALIGLLGSLPSFPAALAGIALFVLYRPFYYTAVSDYAAKVFGFQTFGKVYGLIICLAGVVNFVQSGLDALTHRGFGGDPTPVNVGLEVVGAGSGVALVWFVWGRAGARAGKRGELEAEAEGAGEVGIPEVAGGGVGQGGE